MGAASALAVMTATGNPLCDGFGSMGVGVVLAYIAKILVQRSTMALIGKSVPDEQKEKLKDDLENHSAIRGVYDLKCTYVGPARFRLKAEIDVDGRNIGKHYLEHHDVAELQNEMAVASKSLEGTEEFLLRHAEGSIDQLGDDIDRIEADLKRKHRLLKHIDLELN